MPHALSAPTSEFRGAARLHRAASPGTMGWASWARSHLAGNPTMYK